MAQPSRKSRHPSIVPGADRPAWEARLATRIEHVALWTDDPERSRRFYVEHTGARASALYRNEATGFESYFLEFDGGPRLELMRMPTRPRTERNGHVAFSVGSEAAVDAKTEELRAAGYVVAGEPRRTGDGHYESVVLDPHGNRLELTA
jgi:lactoylglutathione lyase